jgi:hypothetical protein
LEGKSIDLDPQKSLKEELIIWRTNKYAS